MFIDDEKVQAVSFVAFSDSQCIFRLLSNCARDRHISSPHFSSSCPSPAPLHMRLPVCM
jgi:hypothetical protein